jgi:acetyl-CoA carboxylase biotin carboxylase subunit
VEQIKVAAGLPLGDRLKNLSQRGHAIECRMYAEDGENNFMPSIGTIVHYSEPEGPGVRVDSGIMSGMEIGIHYDPIMAKLIVHAPDRTTAITKMTDALEQFKILGVKTSRRFMIEALNHPEFIAGRTYTSFIDDHMSSREAGSDEYQALAAAVASVMAVSPLRASSRSGGLRKTLVTPWDSIGAWQIGDAIGE